MQEQRFKQLLVEQAQIEHGHHVLDFGCGRGTLKTELAKIDPGAEVSEYDPGIPGKDVLPAAADLLVATDVLEHIEPVFLHSTLDALRQLAIRAGYFTIALVPAKETLPDGRNAHICLMTSSEWMTKLRIAGFQAQKAEVNSKGLWVWCT